MFGKQQAAFWSVHEYLFDPDVYECSVCGYEACEKVVKEHIPLTQL